jgi:hypothetical protein
MYFRLQNNEKKTLSPAANLARGGRYIVASLQYGVHLKTVMFTKFYLKDTIKSIFTFQMILFRQ